MPILDRAREIYYSRLNYPAAVRAEAQVMNPASQMPIEEAQIGVNQVFEIGLNAVSCAEVDNKLTFSGTWILRGASISNLGKGRAPSQIVIRRVTPIYTQFLATGDTGEFQLLCWTGEIILAGDWEVGGHVWTGYEVGVCNLAVVAEKIRAGV